MQKQSTNNRKSSRQVTNVGAIYRPPSPLSVHHLRDWPESGMHERPEYNPETNILEPFDTIIGNISVNYKNPATSTIPKLPEKSSERKELKWVCHDMLHHVFAFSATVKQFISEKSPEKTEFMNDLSLMDSVTGPLNLTKSNKAVLYDFETDEEREKIKNDILGLVENSILLYSLTNEVDSDNLSKYIDSLKPNEIIDWSNKQFNLVD